MKIPEMSESDDADDENVGTGMVGLRRVETLCGCKSEYRMTELLKTLNSKLTDAAVLLLLHRYSQNGLEESPLTKQEKSAIQKLSRTITPCKDSL